MQFFKLKFILIPSCLYFFLGQSLASEEIFYEMETGEKIGAALNSLGVCQLYNEKGSVLKIEKSSSSKRRLVFSKEVVPRNKHLCLTPQGQIILLKKHSQCSPNKSSQLSFNTNFSVCLYKPHIIKKSSNINKPKEEIKTTQVGLGFNLESFKVRLTDKFNQSTGSLANEGGLMFNFQFQKYINPNWEVSGEAVLRMVAFEELVSRIWIKRKSTLYEFAVNSLYKVGESSQVLLGLELAKDYFIFAPSTRELRLDTAFVPYALLGYQKHFSSFSWIPKLIVGFPAEVEDYRSELSYGLENTFKAFLTKYRWNDFSYQMAASYMLQKKDSDQFGQVINRIVFSFSLIY